MRWLVIFAPICLFGQTYSLPNDDSGCPGNCRVISWLAGADTWNGSGTPGTGSLPTRTGVACNGLTEGTGTTDNTSAINACLAAISSDQASVIPAGIYYVNGSVVIPANKSLRGSGAFNCAQGNFLSTTFRGDTGAGAACTTLNLGTNGIIKMYSGTGSSTGSTYNLSSGYGKSSTSVLTSTTPSGLTINGYAVLNQLNDSAIPVTAAGEDGTCTWCAGNTPTRAMTQVVQITNKSGTTVTISRPLYYNFQAGLTPQIYALTGTIEKAGLESLKVDDYVYRASRTSPMVQMDGCMHCWVENSEMFMSPATSGAYPIEVQWSYGGEIRGNYMHGGVQNASGQNYAPGLFEPVSDFMVVDNIIREVRHALAQEGGGSGNVFLYNYVDDLYDTTDYTYLGSGRINHGAHPFMNLLEGNIISHYAADSIWGTSSHNVYFRNWFWGDATGNYSGWTSSNPNYGFAAVDISDNQHYYSLVGNVLGKTGAHTTWSSATLINANCGTDPTRTTPVVYYMGCLSAYGTPAYTGGPAGYDSATRSTAILHGNYDYKTAGVAYWDGGANHGLSASLYYPSKPAFMGNCIWPGIGPDIGTLTNPIPAQQRYLGTSCPAVNVPASVMYGVISKGLTTK